MGLWSDAAATPSTTTPSIATPGTATPGITTPGTFSPSTATTHGLQVKTKDADMLFRSFDPDGSGSITLQELNKSLRR